MYIKQVNIENIRSITDFKMEFIDGKEAGWHVIIGDNGSGKTTIMRAIALALIGPNEILRLDPIWENWLQKKQSKALIKLTVSKDTNYDKRSISGGKKLSEVHEITSYLELSMGKESERVSLNNLSSTKKDKPEKYHWGTGGGWFSCSFGPFRRFTGGNSSLEQHYIRNPKIGAHLTLFKEDAALTESVVWLKDIYLRSLEHKSSESEKIYKGIKYFINQEGLLPPNYSFEEINADGVFLRGGEDNLLPLYELSEGIKSILSLAFELIRLLIERYGADAVFGNFLDSDDTNNYIPVPGVVLIDEIDAHLHPTWQTRIGDWFIQCFPNIQFIVTTHSPLTCRACHHGTIWRLPIGGDENSFQGEITGTFKDRLVFGNVLDAFGTDAFGKDVQISSFSQKQLETMAVLNVKDVFGSLSEKENVELNRLKNIYTTTYATTKK